MAASLVVAFLVPRTYTARASFVPQQGRSQMSGIASLAAQFGVSVPVLDATRTPAFYVNLLDSKNLLLHVVETGVRVSLPATAKPEPLTDYLFTRERHFYELSAKGRTPGERDESAVKKLRRHVEISVDQKAGLVGIEVQLRDPVAARDVVGAFLAQLDSFNLRTRQSQAGSERKFTEARLIDARNQLRAAEDELMSFLQRNRDYRSSPQLTFLHDRLERNVFLYQRLYETLSQSYEQARIEEVRDTPVITVVEDPLIPAKPDPRPFGRAIAAGLLLGIAGAVVLGRRRDRLASDLRS
jgi:uncharacterized protein involved in exopolysaccharide biosynthesis